MVGISSRRNFTIGPSPADITVEPEFVRMIVSPDTKTITLKCPCSGQAFYSAIRNKWEHEPALMRLEYPIRAINPAMFEMMGGWKVTNPELIHLNTFNMETGFRNGSN